MRQQQQPKAKRTLSGSRAVEWSEPVDPNMAAEQSRKPQDYALTNP